MNVLNKSKRGIETVEYIYILKFEEPLANLQYRHEQNATIQTMITYHYKY